MTRTVTIWSRAAMFVAALVVASSCDPEQPCQSRQVYDRGVCRLTVDDAGPSASQGDASVVEAAPASPQSGACAAFSGYGETCKQNSDCKCGLECNVFGGGYCTRQAECLMDPTVCPQGWKCYDRSAWGLRPLCQKP